MTIATTDHAPTSLGVDHDRHEAIDLRSVLPHMLPEVQQREALDETRIRAYAALYREGYMLGEVMVFQQGQELYVADGFHRITAAIQAGLDTLAATIRPGTRRDAILYACGCNLHGVPLTQADKRRRVLTMLADPEWQQWSDREIARHCGVSHVFVAKRRKALTGNVTSERTYRTKQGTVTTMNTRAIGKHAALDMSEDSTTTAEMAADNTVPEAVDQARPSHNRGLTTPDGAEAVCDAAERHVMPVAPDNSIHDGHTKDAEAARAAFPTRLSRLFDLLQALATFPELEPLLLDMPPDCYDRLDQYLDPAFATLNRLRTFRKEHRHATPGSLVPPPASQRVRQPTKRKTRRKTKAQTRQSAQTAQATTVTAPSQPDLLLAAIRTAPQPLTIEDLRQLPSVDGSRAKRNVTRLVEQRKIQETPAGYVVVST